MIRNVRTERRGDDFYIVADCKDPTDAEVARFRDLCAWVHTEVVRSMGVRLDAEVMGTDANPTR